MLRYRDGNFRVVVQPTKMPVRDNVYWKTHEQKSSWKCRGGQLIRDKCT